MFDDAYANYFADREHIERDMSNRTADPKVAAIHAELADRYEALAVVFGVKRAAASQIRA